MASRARRAAAARAAAATAEVAEQRTEQVVKWRDLSLTVPGSLPLAVAFDMAEAEEDGAGALDQQTVFRVLRAVLGREQFRQVRNYVADERITVDEGMDVLVDLFEAVTRTYGFEPGESSASDGS